MYFLHKNTFLNLIILLIVCFELKKLFFVTLFFGKIKRCLHLAIVLLGRSTSVVNLGGPPKNIKTVPLLMYYLLVLSQVDGGHGVFHFISSSSDPNHVQVMAVVVLLLLMLRR